MRSLTSEEIVAQSQYLFAERGINPAEVKRMQIMFMSMGEPLLNWSALADAIEKLYGLYPKSALLISTSAPRVDYRPMRELSRAIPTIGLQFSIHESTDEARDRLIPFKQKLTLVEISSEGMKWHEAVGRRPFFNYCAHTQNVGEEDAARLQALFSPNIWEATISVVCERDESVAAANERQRALAVGFRAKLGKLGFSTRMFDPAGQDDIGGGCGQLWFVQDWMRQHPNLAKPSIGNSLPAIHTPR